jgi:hypothetical protein
LFYQVWLLLIILALPNDELQEFGYKWEKSDSYGPGAPILVTLYVEVHCHRDVRNEISQNWQNTNEEKHRNQLEMVPCSFIVI